MEGSVALPMENLEFIGTAPSRPVSYPMPGQPISGVLGGASDHGGYTRASVPSGPTVWTSPFGAAISAFGRDPQAVTGALAAAAEAENHVRLGFVKARTWWPSMVHRLRGYFAVSHFSIGQKLAGVFIPLLSYRSGSRGRDFGWNGRDRVLSGSHETSEGYDIHCLGPDLYLPFMAYLTYVLLYGFVTATRTDFHPELLSTTASFAALVTLVEVLVLTGILYLWGVDIPILDILSATGVKFQCLVPILGVAVLARGHPTVRRIAFLYLMFCAAHAMFQYLRASESKHRVTSEWGSHSDRPTGVLYVLLIAAVAQMPFCWLLSPSFVLSTNTLTP